MPGDITHGHGAAESARRLAFNVPSASVQNKSLEEARMMLGRVFKYPDDLPTEYMGVSSSAW